MEIDGEQKSPETPTLASNFLAPMHNQISPSKTQKQLEQALGDAILKQDTQAITNLVKNGIAIDKQFTYQFTLKNGKERPFSSKPIVFAVIYFDKNNIAAIKTLLELGANFQHTKKPHFYNFNKKVEENIKIIEELCLPLK